MTSELTCKKCKFSVDKLRLGDITDFFTITELSSNSFSFTDGESTINLKACFDDIVLCYSFKGKSFCSKGCMFKIYNFESFCMIAMYDEQHICVFTTSVEKGSR